MKKPVIRRNTPLTRKTRLRRNLSSPPITNEPTPLKKWYLEKIIAAKGRCEECGCGIQHTTESQFGSQAHMLPKKYFPSVETHPLNHMELGMYCGCHQRYDSSWLSASKMKVWQRAKDVITKELIPLLTPKELGRLPELLK